VEKERDSRAAAYRDARSLTPLEEIMKVRP